MAVPFLGILDRSIFTATSSGTGSFVVSSAVTGYQTPSAAGAVDQQQYAYAAQSTDLSQWEYGYGTWTAATSTLTRTIVGNSLGNTSAINFSAAPQVLMTVLGESIVPYSNGQANLALGTITANATALNITATWNNAGVYFDAPLLVNVTNTASASAHNAGLGYNTPSLLMDLQVGGSTQIAADRAGGLYCANLYSAGIGTTGIQMAQWGGANDLLFNSSVPISWNNGTASVSLSAGSAFNGTHALALSGRTTTNPAGFHVYNTADSLAGTNPTNYERAVFDWTTKSNTLTIGMQSGGTGSQRAIVIDNQSGYNSSVGVNEIAIFGRLQLGLTNDNIKFLSSTSGNIGAYLNQNNFNLTGSKIVGWTSNSSDASGIADTALFRDAATGVVAIADKASGTTATGLRVYNTTDNVGTGTAPTNYERGCFDFTTTANVLTIGTQAGGTGIARDVALTAASGNVNVIAGNTLNIPQGTLTANSKGLNITATWNNAAVTFDAPLYMNITNTASVAGSVLMDLLVGGVPALRVDNQVSAQLSSGVLITADSNGGQVRGMPNGGSLALLSGGSSGMRIRFDNASAVFFSDGTTNRFYIDVDGTASTLAVKSISGSAAAALRIYNTTDNTFGAPTNYERGVFDWTTNANTLTIGTQKGGTGTARDIQFSAASTNYHFFGNNSSARLDTEAGSELMLARTGKARMQVGAGGGVDFFWDDDAGHGNLGLGSSGWLMIPNGYSFAYNNASSFGGPNAGGNDVATSRANPPNGVTNIGTTANAVPGSLYTFTGSLGSAPAGTVTISNASPAVFTQANHGYFVGQPILLSTTGTLPTGLSTLTTYYLISAGYTSGAYEVSASFGGAAINTSSAGSGTHTATPGGVVTISNASPAVVTLGNHGLVPGQVIQFQTTGSLPTGLSTGTNYYVLSAGLTSGAFEVSTSFNGAAVNTSSAGSGTQTIQLQTGQILPVAAVGSWGPSQLTGAQTTSALTINQVWNTSGNVDAALKVNVTNVNSGGGSLLADFQVGGTSLLNIGADGHLAISTTNAYPIFITSSNTTWGGINFVNSSVSGVGANVVMTLSGSALGRGKFQWYDAIVGAGLCINFNNNPVIVSARSNGAIGFTNGDAASTCDTFFYRDAAGLMALGNSTNAQAFRVYNTTDQSGTGTAPTNYERGVFDFTTEANVLTIGTQKGGTGSERFIRFRSGGNIIGDYGISFGAGWWNFAQGVNFAGTALFSGNSGVSFSDVNVYRENTHVAAIGTLSTPAAGLRVYNTDPDLVPNPTNYERAIFDWTTSANVLTIGVQHGGTGAQRQINFAGAGQYNFDTTIQGTAFNAQFSGNTSATVLNSGPAGFRTVNNGLIGFSNGASAFNSIDVGLYRDTAVGVLALADFASTTTATGFRVYNTTDQVAQNVAPTNYERGIFDWTTTANVLTIGTQKGGTGSARNLALVAGTSAVLTVEGSAIFGTIPSLYNGSGDLNIGAGSRNVTFGGQNGTAAFDGILIGGTLGIWRIRSTAAYSWSQQNDSNASSDTFLWRNSAGIVTITSTNQGAVSSSQGSGGLAAWSAAAGNANLAGTNFNEYGSTSTGGATSGNWIINTGFTGTGASGTCTISNASPAVITIASHNFFVGEPVLFSTTGALPTGLSTLTTYYIISAGFAAGAFEVSTSFGGSAVNTSSAGSGTQTVSPGGVCTISNASPAVITLNNHGLVPGMQVQFATTGALPTGLSTATTYYVISAGLTVNAFEVSATLNGSAVNTSSTGSGTQTVLYQGGTTQNPAYTLATWGPSQLTGTQTTPALSISQLWNTSGVVDAALKLNVTNVNSGAGSLLADFQVNGSSALKVDTAGNATAASAFIVSSSHLNAINLTVGPTSGSAMGNFWIFNGSFFLTIANVGSDQSNTPFAWAFAAGIAEYKLPADGHFGFTTSNGTGNAGLDTNLARRAAGVMSLQNGSSLSSACGWQVYNTVDTGQGAPTNYERGVFDWTTKANTLTIGMQSGGTGSQRAIVIDNQSGYTSSVGTNEIAIFGRLQLGLANDSIRFLCAQSGNNGALMNQNNFTLTSNKVLNWSTSSSDATGSVDTGLQRVAAKVTSFSDGAANANGWMQWAGEARLDADFSKTSSAVLANVTGTSHNLSVNLQAGRTYIFEAVLFCVSGTTGGIQVALGGTATVTSLLADANVMDSTTNVSTTRVTALASTLVNAAMTTGTQIKVYINGVITVNAAGTFTIQFAQHASNATASTVKAGSYMLVQDTP